MSGLTSSSKGEIDFSGIVRKTPPPKDDAGGRPLVRRERRGGRPCSKRIAGVIRSRCVIAYRQAPDNLGELRVRHEPGRLDEDAPVAQE
jgi:hypothetical protein